MPPTFYTQFENRNVKRKPINKEKPDVAGHETRSFLIIRIKKMPLVVHLKDEMNL